MSISGNSPPHAPPSGVEELLRLTRPGSLKEKAPPTPATPCERITDRGRAEGPPSPHPLRRRENAAPATPCER
eukprot:1363140-Pyramimonas_sp.AAC.1